MHRVSDLLDRHVVDEHGRDLGAVHDVHLVQDGPLLAGGLAAPRIHGLLAGRASVGTLLGYVGRPGYAREVETKGPWPIRAFVRWLHRHATYVPWDAVRELGPERIVVDASALHGP